MNEECRCDIILDAKLAFEELPLEGRMAVIDDLLAELDADEVRHAVGDPEALSIMAEAHIVSIRKSDDLLRYLQRDDLARLKELVECTLLERLPNRL